MTLKLSPAVVQATLDTDTKTSDEFNPLGRRCEAAVAGTFVANLRLQQWRGEVSAWFDVFVFERAELIQLTPVDETTKYRFTMAGDGDFTSGSAAVFIGH